MEYDVNSSPFDIADARLCFQDVLNIVEELKILLEDELVPQGGIQNSKFKIQAGIQRKHFVDLEWVAYLRRPVLE